MRVIWTSIAIRERKAIWQYIAAEDRQAANRLDMLTTLGRGRYSPKL